MRLLSIQTNGYNQQADEVVCVTNAIFQKRRQLLMSTGTVDAHTLCWTSLEVFVILHLPNPKKN
jgi:hypothetical protein